MADIRERVEEMWSEPADIMAGPEDSLAYEMLAEIERLQFHVEHLTRAAKVHLERKDAAGALVLAEAIIAATPVANPEGGE